MTMTGPEYEAAIGTLGLNQVQASKLFGKDPRTGRRWVKDGVQEPMIVVLLKLMVTGKVSVQDVERIRKEEESRGGN